MELTAKEEDTMLEEGMEKYYENKYASKIEQYELYELFMSEYESDLKKEFKQLWEGDGLFGEAEEYFMNAHEADWKQFCKEAFNDYVNELRMKHG